jgi:transcriptional regulator with XRE-family HTH domain
VDLTRSTITYMNAQPVERRFEGNDDGQHCGERLANLRKALGLTGQEMAVIAEVSGAMISHHEHNRRELGRDSLWKVAQFVGKVGNVDPRGVAAWLRGYQDELVLTPIMHRM